MGSVGVVGATGNVGRPLVRRLVEEQVSVRALTRDVIRARTLLPIEVDVVEASLDSATELDRALAGCEAVFLACGNGPRQAELEEAVVYVAVRRRVKRLVKLSSIAAATDPGSLHRGIEVTIERTGLRHTHLRPSMFMQSLLTLAEAGILGAYELRLPLGDASIDAVDVRDIADAACAALLDPSGADTRALLGQHLPMTAVASELSEALGRPVEYVDVSSEQAAGEWVAAGLAPALASMLTGIFETLRTTTPINQSRDPRDKPRTWCEAARLLAGDDGSWRDLNLVRTLPSRAEIG